MSELAIQQLGKAVVFTVKVVPGSSRTQFGELLNGMVKIRVSAAPQKGKANKELVDFLAKQLGVRSRAVSIISGHKTAVKQVQVSGLEVQRIVQIIEHSNLNETSA
jgi:uncharacterized protein (TIGR00251 family)